MFIKTKELPQILQAALSQVGYGKPDISVEIKETFQNQSFAGTGSRSFVCLVDLDSGQTNTQYGSWGGPTPFSGKSNLVDHNDANITIGRNLCLIKGTEGGGHPVSARLMISRFNLVAGLLPVQTEVSAEEKSALNIVGGIKSGYRVSHFADAKLGIYGPQNPHILSLAAKGLVKIAGGKSIQITTEGKNIRTAK